MSKVLDDDIAISPQDAYNELVDAFSRGSNNFSNLLEIEILPKCYPLPSGYNVLLHENCIGVPKLHLIQAFVVARQMFLKRQDLRNSTAVILLINPEHITAANARKRLIKACSGAELHVALAEELMFTDSMLTSQLQRHTKSPTLWGHRRWLLELGKSVGMSSNIQRDLASVVLVAAERHPRNYYAWLHLRWLLQTFGGGFGKLSHEPEAFDSSKLLSIVSKWCLQHPSDTSGFSFLSFCLSSLGSSNESAKELQRKEAISLICKEVLDFAISIRWTQESLWVFVRTLVASGEVTKDQRAAFFQHIQAIQEMQPANSRGHLILQKAHDWCVDYEQNGELKS